MKKLVSAFALVMITLLTFNCQKEISYNGTGGTIPGNSPLTATVQGNILDENGQPAAGVTVKVGNKMALTNAKGYFRIAAAALDRNASHVIAEKGGYFRAHRTFQATEGVNQVVIRLIPKSLAGTVNATSGGEVTLSNGARIVLPANAITSGSGPYSGSVQVYAAYIDPTSATIAESIPGSFMADDKNNNRVILESFGMMAVELESPSGEKLQIAQGKTASLTVPIPTSTRASAPASIALWYVNEETGIWKEEGSAVKTGNNYVGEVKHFSFWNCDIGVPTVNLSMTVKNTSGDPIVHALVRISQNVANGFITGYGYTDSLGRVSGLVPANQPLTLEILDPCYNPVYTQALPSMSQNTNLGVVTISGANSSMVTVAGRILNCGGQPVTSGYAIINFNNIVRYASVNNFGQFEVSFITCASTSSQFEITAVDQTQQQQGNTVVFPITGALTNAGDLTACGVSTEQYIQYVLNGTSYSILSSVPDSLMGFTWQQGSVPFTTYISGYGMANNNAINLEFLSNALVAGTYPVSRLYVHEFNQIGLISPFNISVTNFPATPGGFYEGSFSGQFRDTSNLSALHNLSGTFRIRR